MTEPTHRALTQRQAVALVFCCTLIGSAAQMLMKVGANAMLEPSLTAFLFSAPLMAGYTLYGLSTLLLVFALRDGDLSVLWPVIALSYAWVTMISPLLFPERLNGFKIAGVTLVILGVGVLGRSSTR